MSESRTAARADRPQTIRSRVMLAPSSGPSPVQTTTRPFAYRPALDGVRALAVAAVLLFHGGWSLLPGGFLGVDAFFVLSGFLITSLLLAERAHRGRIALAAFWGRRARRLLPALLLVLVTVAVVGRFTLPAVELALLRGDALAALGYLANWRMIFRGTDYFAQTAAPSPLQHTWSLGIEEQFYLLWPLIVVWWASRRARGALLAFCLGGAAASAIAAGLLYHPMDTNRAYFGTDTRAQALLIGCALAVMLAGGRAEAVATEARHARTRHALAAAALLGVAALGWLWTHADGADAWLYRGGLTAGALAVAAVLAHALVSPAGAIGRALAVPPLVWLGRISYGVYLWHWPLFGWLTADRTGLTGAGLLALRCAVTLAVATASYLLIEEPILRGRMPAWLGALRGRASALAATAPRPTPTRVLAGVTGVMMMTAGVIVIATVPPPRRAPVPIYALPTAPPPTPTAASANPADRSPMYRAGRKPGKEPRITFFGDSVSWSLGTYLPPHPGLTVTVRAMQGCGIARLPEIIQLDAGHTNYPACPTWDARWRRGLAADDPDVAVILLDRWELMDRRLDGEWRHVGEPEYDAYLMAELDLAVTIAGSRGARVVLLTAPYTRRSERPDGSLYDEDKPERVDAWNHLLWRMANSRRNVAVIDLNRHVCPDGEFTWTVDGVQVRSDGLHFTEFGVQQIIAPWLLPQLASIATGTTQPVR
jgi:peptidoglycan/LPS O-acetylase OafA/YrhL